MGWLLFLDESGHDHLTMPYEVRGGIALHAGKIWPFVQGLQRLEIDVFGAPLALFRKEIKGCTLLDKDRFRWANQDNLMDDAERRKHCRGFLTKGLEKLQPTRQEFTAYGQACLAWVRGMFQLLLQHDAVLFAAVIPQSVIKPDTYEAVEFLRKDQVFLLERYYYFLEEKQEHGLLVMDEVDKTDDRRFVKRLESYFRKTQTGQFRSQWIVPVPFFVASDMAYPVQVADVCIYCVNCGFRYGTEMMAPHRQDITDEFSPWLHRLQYRGEASREGITFRSYGIVYVPDPYESRLVTKEKRR